MKLNTQTVLYSWIGQQRLFSEIDEILDEFLKNNQNSIDILEILWQNIVLEIPLKYTKEEDLSKYQGDGWKLISEDEVKRDNPFSILAENMKKE